MKHSIADDKNNLKLLRSLRESLVSKEEDEVKKLKDKARWQSFGEAVDNIRCACEDEDLGKLAQGVRRMKNMLRRPGIRKILAQLEDQEKGKDGEDKKPEGACSCAQCGKVIDGTAHPCTKDAMCVKCAMKNRDVPPGEKEDDKDEKKAKKSGAFPPEMMGQGGGEKGAPGGPPGGAPEGEPEEEPPAKEPPPQFGKKKKGKKKDKDKDKDKKSKKWMQPGKKERTEGKLRCRNYRMSAVFEDDE